MLFRNDEKEQIYDDIKSSTESLLKNQAQDGK